MKLKYQTEDNILFDSEAEAKVHETCLGADEVTQKLERYKQLYAGVSLIKLHPLTEYGVWEVKGEDPNCDFGGSHYNPYLFTAEGLLLDVLKKAVVTQGFWCWGGGGEIKKIEVEKV